MEGLDRIAQQVEQHVLHLHAIKFREQGFPREVDCDAHVVEPRIALDERGVLEDDVVQVATIPAIISSSIVRARCGLAESRLWKLRALQREGSR
jgi:hypothetical protein